MANTTENINYKITVDAQTGTAVVRDLKGQIIATKVPVKQLRDEFGNFAKTVNATNFNKFNKGLSTATKANKNLGDASGAATSSVMELSRVVSDAPYGIRGMANNITQLVSQMGFASKKAGGFGNALKEMGKQFMGPLGIVFVVTAAVSALDYFYGAAKKAEKAVKDLTRETYANSLVAKQYVQELEDVNITEERRKVVTQELIKLVPTLTEQDLKYGENLDKVRLKINSYALAQASRIEIDKLVQENSESLSAKNELESIKKIDDAEERVSRMKKFILETGKDLSGFILGFGDEGLIKDGDIDQIEETFGRLGRVIDKQSKPILTRINELTKALQLDPDKTKNKIEPKPIVVGLELEAKGVEDVVSGSQELVNGKPVLIPVAFNPITPDDIATFIENYKVLMSGVTDFVDGEFERQLTTEQNKTNALNEELNNRLLNESLSEEKRKSIQNQIAQNDEALRVKQDAIKKKQFKQQKAFNISMAIISTYSAAAKTLNETPGGSFARIAGMVAVIGSGLAQVAAISRQKFQSSSAQSPINTSSQGGAAGGGGRSESSFNVVGKSEGNLLINAIQAQFGKPLKAYVVSREVTNQQQLDGIIVNQAST
jgi:hypothetical protein